MLTGAIARLRAFLARRRHDDDHLEELHDHLDREIERNIARGLAPDEARRQAGIAFGNLTNLREDGRAATRGIWTEQLIQDVRYAARMLRRNPAFTFAAVLSLGFGIGATTTVFSTVDALDFRPLGFREPDRLVWIAESAPPTHDVCPGCSLDISAPTSIDWLSQARSYTAAAALNQTDASWVHNDVIEGIPVNQVTPGFFGLLSVRVALGRDFLPSDTVASAPPVVLVTHGFWQHRLGGDSAAIGRTLPSSMEAGTDRQLRGATVVGVLPAGFRYDLSRDRQVWLPLRLSASSSRADRSFTLVARLRDGTSLTSARTEWHTLFARLAAEHPDVYQSWSARVEPLRARLGWGAGGNRGLLLGIAGMVLAVAVVNVAGLLSGRASARRQEFAMRSAFGANRRRLFRQLLVEGTSIGLGGGLLGALLALWGVRFSAHWFRLDPGVAVIDLRVLAFAIVLSVVVGIVTASGPALRVSRVNLIDDLRGKGVAAIDPRTTLASRSLIIAQIAIGLMLVTAAGLLTNDFLKLRYTDLGFDPAGVYTTYLPSPPRTATSDDPTAWRVSAEESRTRVAMVPGVRAAGLQYRSAIHPEIVRPVVGGSSSVTPSLVAVDPSYFEIWGMRILRGRAFLPADDRGADRVVIVNRSTASRFWPGVDPIGRQVFVGDSGSTGELLTVVGLADDAERGEMVERHWPVVYRPLSQATFWHNAASLQLRVDDGVDRAAILAQAQSRIREVMQRPTNPFRSVEAALDDRLRPRRLNAIVLNLFAAFGIALAAMGMYASIAAALVRRRSEIGVRMALGARSGHVLWKLLAGGLTLAVVGIGAGLAGAMALTGVLRSVVAGTDHIDPLLFAAAAAVMFATIGAATLIPALRVLRVNPVDALRTE